MTKNITKILCLLLSLIMIASMFNGCGTEEDPIPEVVPEKQMFIDKYELNPDITNNVTYRIDYMTYEDAWFDEMDIVTMFDPFKVQVDDWKCIVVGTTTMGEIVDIINASNKNYVTSKRDAIIAERQAVIDAEYNEAVRKATEKGKTYDKPKKEVYTDDIHFDEPYTYTVILGDYDEEYTEEYKPTLLIDPYRYDVIYFDVAKYGIPYVRFEFHATTNRIKQESEWIVNGIEAADVSQYGINEEGVELESIPEFVGEDMRNQAAKQNIIMSGNIAFSGDGFTWESLMLLCNALQLNWDEYNHGFEQSSDENFTYYTITIHTNPFTHGVSVNDKEVEVLTTRLIATFNPLSQVCLNWTIDTYNGSTVYDDRNHDLSEPIDVNVHEYQVDTNDYPGMRAAIRNWIIENAADITSEYCAIDMRSGEMFGIVNTGLVNLFIEPTINGVVYTCLDQYDSSNGVMSGRYISNEDLEAADAIEDVVDRDMHINEKSIDLTFSCSLLNGDGEIVADFAPTTKSMSIDNQIYHVVSYDSTEAGYKNVTLLTEENINKLIVLYTKTYTLNEEENAELLSLLQNSGAISLEAHINDKFADAEKAQEEYRKQQANKKLIAESAVKNTNANIGTLTVGEELFSLNDFSSGNILGIGYQPSGACVQYGDLINIVGSTYKNDAGKLVHVVEQNGEIDVLVAETDDILFYNGIKVGMTSDEVNVAIADENIAFENGTLIMKSKAYTMILVLDANNEVVEKIYLISNDYYETMPRQSSTESDPTTPNQDEGAEVTEPTEVVETEQQVDDSTPSMLHSVDDVVSDKNNMFNYNEVSIAHDESCITIMVKSQENITSEKLPMNIRVKFYDENKNEMIDFQYRDPSDEIDEVFYIHPEEPKSTFFNLYAMNAEIMIDGLSLKDVKYFSIEDIEWSVG